MLKFVINKSLNDKNIFFTIISRISGLVFVQQYSIFKWAIPIYIIFYSLFSFLPFCFLIAIYQFPFYYLPISFYKFPLFHFSFFIFLFPLFHLPISNNQFLITDFQFPIITFHIQIPPFPFTNFQQPIYWLISSISFSNLPFCIY